MASVLIIENEEAFAQELNDGLVAHGVEVTVLADGKAAIAHAAQALPDLVIVTAELPKMNGFTVCNRLRKSDKLKKTPVVLLSADASEETFAQHRKMEKKRADAYVHKPVTFQNLVPTLEQFIELGGGQPQPVREEEIDAALDSLPPDSGALQSERAPRSDLPDAESVSPVPLSVDEGAPPAEAMIAELESSASLEEPTKQEAGAETEDALASAAEAALAEVVDIAIEEDLDDLEEIDLGELEELPEASEALIDEAEVGVELEVEHRIPSSIPQIGAFNEHTQVSAGHDPLDQAQPEHTEVSASFFQPERTSERPTAPPATTHIGTSLEIQVTELTRRLSDTEETNQAQLESITNELEQERKTHQQDLETLSGEMAELRTGSDAALQQVRSELTAKAQALAVAQAGANEEASQAALNEVLEEHKAQVARHTQVLQALRAENTATISRLEAEQGAALHTVGVDNHKAMQSVLHEAEATLSTLRAEQESTLATLKQEHDGVVESLTTEHQSTLQNAKQELTLTQDHAASDRLQFETTLREKSEEHDALQATLTRTQEQARAVQNELEAAVSTANSQTAEAQTTASREREAAEEERASLDKKLQVTCSQLEHAHENIETLEERLDQSLTQISSLIEQRESDHDVLTELKRVLRSVVAKVDELQNRASRPPPRG